MIMRTMAGGPKASRTWAMLLFHHEAEGARGVIAIARVGVVLGFRFGILVFVCGGVAF